VNNVLEKKFAFKMKTIGYLLLAFWCGEFINLFCTFQNLNHLQFESPRLESLIITFWSVCPFACLGILFYLGNIAAKISSVLLTPLFCIVALTLFCFNNTYDKLLSDFDLEVELSSVQRLSPKSRLCSYTSRRAMSRDAITLQKETVLYPGLNFVEPISHSFL
jgi:hypothetical protein